MKWRVLTKKPENFVKLDRLENKNRLRTMKIIKPIIFVFSVLLLTTSCSPRISEIWFQPTFQRHYKGEFVTDSTTSLTIIVNTYKGLFKGRESFFHFAENYYNIKFNKIDTLYTETDIKYFQTREYNGIDSTFIPYYCKLKIEKTTKNKIYIDFEIQDPILPDILKGNYKLKFKNPYPNLETRYKFYQK